MPLISCLLATYGRPPNFQHLLEESIESFLRQDYLEKELIIVNDHPDQVVKCYHKQVLTVNLPRRCRTLGEKYNFAASLAQGKYLCTWDDDDIHLPWRLSHSAAMITDHDYYNPNHYWFKDNSGYHHEHGTGNCQTVSLISREGWDKVNGFPTNSGAQDELMHYKLKDLNNYITEKLEPSQWFYIYRWGVHPHHLSGAGANQKAYDWIAEQDYKPGIYTLKPRWVRDYVADTRKYCQEKGLA